MTPRASDGTGVLTATSPSSTRRGTSLIFGTQLTAATLALAVLAWPPRYSPASPSASSPRRSAPSSGRTSATPKNAAGPRLPGSSSACRPASGSTSARTHATPAISPSTTRRPGTSNPTASPALTRSGSSCPASSLTPKGPSPPAAALGSTYLTFRDTEGRYCVRAANCDFKELKHREQGLESHVIAEAIF